jgi:hypothetical protein
MKHASIQSLVDQAKSLIEEAAHVCATQFDTGVWGAPTYVDAQSLHRWWGKVKSLGVQLGSAVEPWRAVLLVEPDRNTLGFVKRGLGTLEALKHQLEHGYLEKYSDVVRADTLADLLEQAEHLLDAGYHIAAAVVARAVLEEHLRTVCATLGCSPQRSRPTINDFNQALYAYQHYSKTKLKHIESLAATGNAAAHNEPELTAPDVARLIRELPEVLESTKV